ncbi:MAG: recombinase RecT [Acidobacteriota bacterium]
MAPNQIQLARNNIVQLLEKQKAQITMALPKHLTADRLCRVAVTEMSKNPQLFQCDPTSVLASIITGAQLGLEFGVDGQAYLIPYKGVCQFVPGWKGYVDLISRAGRAAVWTGAVRPGDEFDYDLGDKPFVSHKPGDDDVTPFTKVYAVGRINGAQWPVIEVWSRKKVESHLKRYNKVGDRHYALQNENNLEMYGRKVALLQVMKYMPKSVEVRQAQELEYRAEDGLQNLTISKSGIIDADFVDLDQKTDAAGDHTGKSNLADAVKSRTGKQNSDAEPAVQHAAQQTNNSDAELFGSN